MKLSSIPTTYILYGCILVAMLLVAIAYPIYLSEMNTRAVIENFRLQGEVTTTDTPPVSGRVSVEISDVSPNLSSQTMAVYDIQRNRFESFTSKDTRGEFKVGIQDIRTNPVVDNPSALFDDRQETFASFEVTRGETNQAEIQITTEEPLSVAWMQTSLAQGVTSPNTIEIVAEVDGQERIVLAETRFDFRVNFPETRSDSWTIRYTYTQPLRINNILLDEMVVPTLMSQEIEFVALPNTTYQILADPQTSRAVPTQAAHTDYTEEPQKLVLDAWDNNPAYEAREALLSAERSTSQEVDSEPSYPLVARYPWLPWVGIGAVALTLAGLFAVVIKQK